MRILIVNDDGIRSPGLISLAKMAVQLGEVWVVAPDNQCSAMSQRISVFGSIHVREVPAFPVRDARAWSISGSPADCVKVALSYVMKEKPDVVFSGINNGYNVGVDILYSGTVGAAIEALVNGIPAIAFSNKTNDDQRVSERYLLPIAKDLLTREIEPWAIWNVNFPACDPDEIKGILEDRVPAKKSYYETIYTPVGSGEIPGDPLPGAAEAAAYAQNSEKVTAAAAEAGTPDMIPDDPRTKAGLAMNGGGDADSGLLDGTAETENDTGTGHGAASGAQMNHTAASAELALSSIAATDAEEGSDMKATFDGYISIGKVKSALLEA